MLIQQIQQGFSNELATLDLELERYIAHRVPLIGNVATHLVSSGGKRIRALLTLATARIFGNSLEKREIFLAAAVELVHNATLLHDDVVDGSSLRRGKATANNLWGNKASILVGDFLFSGAFEMMVKSGSLEALQILARASNVIAEGEVMQLASIGNVATTESSYFHIIEAKTAALFSAASEVGAVIKNCDKITTDIMRDFGYHLGMIFQITDDILDYVGASEKFGKEIASDLREGKMTLPLIFGYEWCDDIGKALIHSIITKNEDISLAEITQINRIITNSDAIAKCKTLSEAHYNQALDLLSKISYETSTLQQLLFFAMNRLR